MAKYNEFYQSYYSIHQGLQRFSSTYSLKKEQREFFAEFLKGRQGKKGWPKFELLSRSHDLTIFHRMLNEIKAEIAREKWKEKNREYKKDLNYRRALEILLEEMQDHINLINKNLALQETGRQQDFTGLLGFYRLTEEEFGGTIMVPLSQNLDPNMGKGQCLGYVKEWMRCFLHHEKPFGISVSGPPPFKRIEGSLAQQFPDLNHLVRISPKITEFQNSSDFKKDLSFSSDKKSQGKVVRKKREFFEFRKTFDPILADKIADKLIEQANKGLVCDITLYEILPSHGLGFAKDEYGRYHFMDANIGWIRFDNSEHFKKWFPEFMLAIHCNETFRGLSFDTYSLEVPAVKAVKQETLITKIVNGVVNFFQNLNPFSNKKEQPIPKPSETIQQSTNDDPFENINLGPTSIDDINVRLPKKSSPVSAVGGKDSKEEMVESDQALEEDVFVNNLKPRSVDDINVRPTKSSGRVQDNGISLFSHPKTHVSSNESNKPVNNKQLSKTSKAG